MTGTARRTRIVIGTMLLAEMALLSGCVTSRKSRRSSDQARQSRTPQVVEKIGSKDPHAVTNDATTAADETAGPAASTDDFLNFVMKHRDQTVAYDARDEQTITAARYASQPTMLTEAVRAIALVDRCIAGSNSSAYEEDDLYQNEAQPNCQLETEAQRQRVDLETALAQNSLLASAGFARKIKAALPADSNGKLAEVIAQKAALWQEVAGGTATAPAPTSTEESAEPNPASNVVHAGDLRAADALLLEAQSLADQRRFTDAIAKAGQIPADSPLHSDAQDRIQKFSNQAVQDLRQKAAVAFQSSIPVNDPKAKTAYLQQAKKYLEEAIAKYPTAEQLPTVKENLAVISRDLEKIDGGGDNAAVGLD